MSSDKAMARSVVILLHGSHHWGRTCITNFSTNRILTKGGVHTTQKDLDVRITGGQMFIYVFLCNEASTASPPGRRVVQDVMDFETSVARIHQFVEFLLQEDILLIDVRVDEAQLGAVKRIFEGSTYDLKHRSNASPPCDHPNFTREGRVVHELAFRTLDANFLAQFEQGDVTRDVTLLVSLKGKTTS